MKNLLTSLMLTALLLSLSGCEERTEKTDSGGVLMEVEFVSTIAVVGVEETISVQIPQIDIDSIVIDPTSPTSSLMDIQLESLEVIFSRADTGTRVPPPFLFNIIGTVPVGGTLTLNNFPIMGPEQTRSEPLSDLLLVNGGFDKETGETLIRLNVTFRAFGRTLTGTAVSSVPRTQSIDFVSTLTGIA